MRRCPLYSLLLLALLPLALLPAAFAQKPPDEPPPKTNTPLVFIVHSYDAGYLWSQGISQGVQEVLRGKARLDTFHLDVRQDMDPERVRARAKDILAHIEALKPQAVIAADDAAQQHLVAPYLKGRATPQVIFCGVNAPPGKYGYPARNVSGVRGRWHFRQSFELLKTIAPKVKRVVFLTDDSESSAYVLGDLEEDRRRHGAFAMQVRVERAGTYQQWQARVRASQKSTDALAVGIYHSLRDERTGEAMSPETVIAWTNSVNKLPSLGFSDYAIRHGQLCGVLGSSHEQGVLAGTMARTVLERGVNAGSLPVRVNQNGIVLVNLKTAERLGLVIPFAIIEAAGVVVQ
jgi:ABC-type uncharacterized transport system substrate-binding protein